MTPHVVIFGAGFGGLELAAGLSESLANEVRVTLIDRNDSFFSASPSWMCCWVGAPPRRCGCPTRGWPCPMSSSVRK